MISYETAQAIIKQKASGRFLDTEWVDVENSVGRVTAQKVYSRKDSPPFDNSAMDGFAVSSDLTTRASETNPLTFFILGSLAAGEHSRHLQATNSDLPVAVEIMTGAPIPRHLHLNAVIKMEEIEKIGGQKIIIKRSLLPEENIRSAGADIAQGEFLVAKGIFLGPEHIMALTSVGISSVSVFRKPRIAVISTGKELVPHTEADLVDGSIYNSTAPYLISAISMLGASPHFHGSVPDDAECFTKLIKIILEDKPDLIVSTGAVSVGKHDFIREALEKMGAEILFHKVAIRPGKPMLFAQIPTEKEKPMALFLGFPGNPVPAATGVRFFIEPCLRSLYGSTEEKPILARTTNRIEKPTTLQCFFKANLIFHQNQLQVQLLSGQESFKIKPLLSANAWAVLPAGQQFIEENELIETFPLYSLRK